MSSLFFSRLFAHINHGHAFLPAFLLSLTLIGSTAPCANAQKTNLDLDTGIFKEQEKGMVIRVPDGDTLGLADRRSIRLACIDAPDLSYQRPSRQQLAKSNQGLREENFRVDPEDLEMLTHEESSKKTKKNQYFAKESQLALKKLCYNKRITLYAKTLKQDAQGRLIAEALLADGTSLTAFLVENGLAYVVYDPDFPKSFYEALLELQVAAIRARRGFWEEVLSQSQAKQTWTGNKETMIFYRAQDIRAQQIKPRLRVYFGNIQDAFLSGFAPASSRDFWPSAQKK